MAGRFRNWCFTWNNPTDIGLSNLFMLEKKVKYFVAQLEMGESGTEHLQAYVELLNPKSLSAVKKFLELPGIHLEIRKGTGKQASEYCKKVESRIQNDRRQTAWEFGEMANQVE